MTMLSSSFHRKTVSLDLAEAFFNYRQFNMFCLLHSARWDDYGAAGANGGGSERPAINPF